jgi:hypothetical protein
MAVMMTVQRQPRAGILRLLTHGCLLLLPALCFSGCGDDIEPEEGSFDRYDACERMVTLCEMSRDVLSPCVTWIEQNFPNKADRILLVQCMQTAPDCTSMKGQCNLDALIP